MEALPVVCLHMPLEEGMKMEHVLFIQRVKEDRKQEYLEAHRNPWSEVVRTIRDSGVKREIIWIQDNTLFVYVMSDNFEKSIAYQNSTPTFRKWLEKMAPLLSEIQDYSGEGTVQRLEKVFDLEEQLERLQGSNIS